MTGHAPVVAAIRIRPVLSPLDRPLRTASGSTDAAPIVLVDVISDDGTVGHAYLFAYRSDMLAPFTRLLEQLSALLLGAPIAPRSAIGALRQNMVLLGTAGMLDMALAALDIALWDVLARSAQLPLVRLLGGEPKLVRAYASFGMDGPQGAAAAAATAVAAGFRAVKVKIGYPTLGEDLAVIRAVRKEAGPGVDIMVDYNQSLVLSEALRRGRALDDEGLAWVEEPLAADALDGHSRITDALVTAVQLGENALGASGIEAILDAHASDLVMIDLVKVGGVTGWLAATSLCDAAGRQYSTHFNQEPSAHLMPLTHGAHLLEYYGVADAVLASPLQVTGGYVTADDRPGNGIEWNEDAVRRFALAEHVIGPGSAKAQSQFPS